MKKLIAPIAALILFTTLTSSSCDKNDDSNNITPSSSTSVASGKWRVSYYYDKTKEETSDYSGNTFEFNSNNTISVSRNGQTISGTWSQISDDGKQKMVLVFNTTDEKILELADDWVIDSKTDSEIKLSGDSKNGTETLHFVK